MQAAAKKHEEKLLKDREIEETKHKIQEKKKTERDEMAARHLQREKNKMSLVRLTSIIVFKKMLIFFLFLHKNICCGTH